MQNLRKHSALLSVLLIGLTLGLATSLGNKFLPYDYKVLAASYSLWMVCAFSAGLFAADKKQSFIYGAITPAIALIISCVTSTLSLHGDNATLVIILLVFITSLILGPALAYLALQWKVQNRKALVIAPVLVSSLLISEGLGYIVSLAPDIIGYAFIALGILAFTLLYRKKQNLFGMSLALIPVSVLLYFVYIISWAVALTAIFWNSGLSDF